MPTSFSDAALLLVGHGSTVNRDSSAPVYQHAAALRQRRIFAEVREGFWKEEPSIRGAVESVTAARLFVVPVLLSEGLFSEEVVPRELGLSQNADGSFDRVLRRPGRALFYSAPIGTHPAMTEVILARARDVVAGFPFPRAPRHGEIALVLAGHGTERNGNSRKAMETHAERIRKAGEFAEVHCVFMEEAPPIPACYSLAQARYLVVVPYFTSEGLHAAEDIPVLLGAPERVVRERLFRGQPPWRNPTEHKGRLVWYGRAVGTDARVTELILERAKEVASAPLDPTQL